MENPADNDATGQQRWRYYPPPHYPPPHYPPPHYPPPSPRHDPDPHRNYAPAVALALVIVLALLVAALFSPFGRIDPASLARSGSAAVAPSGRTRLPATGGAIPTAPASPSPDAGTGGAASAEQTDAAVVDIVTRVPDGVGAGTGIVISASGDVLTNNHVIEGATQIQVTLVTTGHVYPAEVVGTDPAGDVAVIHLTGASDLTVARIGDSDAVEIGDPVSAVGNAGGQGGQPVVAGGNVTALHRQITVSDRDGTNSETLTDVIQVDANVQPGDSGGPLVNADAEVIGIDTAASLSDGRSRRTSAAGHEGFAIPINRAMAIAEQIEADPAAAGVGSRGASRR